MRIADLRDWPSCMQSIRERSAYSNFVLEEESEEDILGRAVALSGRTDQDIAEGMLHAVVSLPRQEAFSHLEQFAAELANLRPDPAAVNESGTIAQVYREYFEEIARDQRGLRAVVETFKVYAEGRHDLRQDSLSLLQEAQKKLGLEPEAALSLVGEAGSLQLRGLGEMDEILFAKSPGGLKEPLNDWIGAVFDVVDSLAMSLEEYPLGEVELVRDQWRAPHDEERLEYRKGKLARLGIREPDVQTLLLPVLAPRDGHLSEKEAKAIVDAGPAVIPGLTAIAGDYDSQIQASISGGQAAITAVELLGELRATEAVPTLLDILQHSDVLSIIRDRTLQVIQNDLPDVAFDQSLELFDRTTDVELKSDLASVLAKGGRGRPGAFERLIGLFREAKSEQELLAGYLADLGDARALPDLHAAFRRSNDWPLIGELEEAIRELGGELTVGERQKLQRLDPRRRIASRPPVPPRPVVVGGPGTVRVTKIGRNQFCPCGSGKKYKKCCGR